MGILRNTVLSNFETADKPTQAQFAQWINLSKFGITQTRAQVQALIAANDLDTNSIYTLTGGPSSNELLVFPTANNALSDGAINLTTGEFGVYDITGNTFTAQGGGGGTPDAIVIPARNNNASPITRGQLVYAVAGTGSQLSVDLARADSASTANVIGMVSSNSINSGAVGQVTLFGVVTQLNTNAFTEGTLLYLSAATAGARTDTVPAAPNYEVKIGTVDIQSTTVGKIVFHPSDPLAQSVVLTEPAAPTSDAMVRQLRKAYTVQAGAPTASDDSGDGYAIGSVLKDTNTELQYLCTDATPTAAVWLNAGGARQGERFLVLQCTGSAVENGTELINAYTYATALGGLSATDRFTIVIPPCTIDTGTEFEMDTDFVDISSLTGQCDVVFAEGIGLIAPATDIRVTGVDATTLPFNVDDGMTAIILTRCKGGDESYGYNALGLEGTFIECVGGVLSFAAGGTITDGTFTDCTAGNNSFARAGTITLGTFTDCKAGDGSFAGNGGTIISGTFIECVGGNESFAGNGGTISSGTFTDCTADGQSFAGNVDTISSSTFTRCTAGNDSFGDTITSGTFTDCTAGGYSFGGQGITSTSTFTRCTAESNSFANGGTAGGTYIECTAGSGSFGGGTLTSDASGTFIRCIGGDSCFGTTPGIATGTFEHCIGGTASWDSLTGKAYFCRIIFDGVSVFPLGTAFACVDGNDMFI